MPDIRVFDDKGELGKQAALCGAEKIRAAITSKGHAHIVLATGASQLVMLASLVQMPGINWSDVTAFHLDEYIGLPCEHKASFRRYLRERFMKPLNGTPTLYEIDGETDPSQEIQRLNQLMANKEIDIAFAGIGENCHLAFNDPPADFENHNPYLQVRLDATCRSQQVKGGWFAQLADVPTHAISMSLHQIRQAHHIILLANGTTKACAIHHAIEGKVDRNYPASILQQHGNTIWFLDRNAAKFIKRVLPG